ncbi:MAG TPA: DUF72 domain-containing protein [Candidatus Binataceae bacterium]|nr:DUF72 domain-containing protein [Candidatus Binataceae bacterium]
MAAVIRIGASGFSYKEWLGNFYPAKLPGARMLSYYAERLPAVEINYTFRALPRRSMLEGWVTKTPDEFRFALKAPQRITHFARLRTSGDTLNYFLETATALGHRLGPILFQLPPDMACDTALLETFLAQLARRVQAAFEFRNWSWFNDEVYGLLRAHQAAMVIAESATISSPVVTTAPHVYLRLRMEAYDDQALMRWAETLRELGTATEAIYVFFKHEASAPELAIRLAQMVAREG